MQHHTYSHTENCLDFLHSTSREKLTHKMDCPGLLGPAPSRPNCSGLFIIESHEIGEFSDDIKENNYIYLNTTN